MITHSLKIPTVCSFGCLPSRKHKDDAGADLRYDGQLPLFIGPGERRNLPTGVSRGDPAGYAGLVCPGSGLAMKHSVWMANGVGVIDHQYRGEIKAILHNGGSGPYQVRRGDRIAQLVIMCVELPGFYVRDALPETERGGNGFGSTGR